MNFKNEGMSLMTLVLTLNALKDMNIEEILSNCNGGYFHVSPNFKKMTIINLGMKKEELIDIVNMKYSVNVFTENFSLDKVMSVASDALFISDGKSSAEKIKELTDKIGKIIGKKTILCTGLGKEIVDIAIKEKDGKSVWTDKEKIIKNENYDIYCCDINNEECIKKLLSIIEKN